jgi:hypothetical protein
VGEPFAGAMPAAMHWHWQRSGFVNKIAGVHRRHFIVLALESSADDTCAAVVTSSGEILSNVVVKQNLVWVHHSTIQNVLSFHLS